MESAVEDIKSCLEAPQDHHPYLQGTYTILQWWYRNDAVWKTKKSRVDLEKVYINYDVLYQ